MSDKAAPGKPPRDRQFPKGQSGNPKGRPKSAAKSHTSAFDVVIDKTLTVTRNGVSREISVEEALQHQTYQAAVQAALSRRRGGNKLTKQDVLEIRRCVSNPDSLRWPKGTGE